MEKVTSLFIRTGRSVLVQVEQYGEEYQDQSWGPLIALVKDNRPPANRAVGSAKDRGAIKELFLTLNGYIQVSIKCPSKLGLATALQHANQVTAAFEVQLCYKRR